MKKLVIVLSAATLVSAIAAGFLWTDLRAERTRLDDLRTQVTALEGRQTASFMPATQTPQAGAVAPAPGAAVEVPPASPGSTTSTAMRERVREGIAKGVVDVLASDAGKDMIRNQLRATLAAQYPDLAAELRMTPAEADKFMDLLARQQAESAGDVLGMTGLAGAATASQDAQRKLLERQLANEKEIARTLGNKYPQWQEYQGTAAAKQQVSQLRNLLGTGQDALTEAQSRPLIAALGAEQTRINKEEQNKMNTSVRSSQPMNILDEQMKSVSGHNERMVNAASPHLTTNQLDRYKQMLGQQEKMMQAIMGTLKGNAAAQGGAAR
jgi:hypothetical protein